jgi:hypothetical protein
VDRQVVCGRASWEELGRGGRRHRDFGSRVSVVAKNYDIGFPEKAKGEIVESILWVSKVPIRDLKSILALRA